MKVRIVPSTRDGRHQLLTSYLVNDTLAVDAGALAVGLSTEEQRRLRSIIITHTHLDHIISLPLYITDLFDELREPVNLFATASDFEALRTYIFNPRVWIDWSILKNAHTELLAWRQYESGESFTAEGLKVTPIPVTHTVLTHALLVEDKNSAVLFTSDTGATDRVWEVANDCPKLRAVLIDLSFPAALTELGRVSKHHSVTTLLEEMEKINPAATVYGIHLKPMYRDQIMAEVEALDNPRLVIAEVGKEYNF
ncbi:MAG TPA: MBL fold metallo-hydrolase [Blastocatellia bacterium]|nr:MBL fold metallo-hydrolase [Blastocatellia bacterium]